MRTVCIVCCLIFSLSLGSCNADSRLKKKYGSDTYFFLGLQNIKNGEDPVKYLLEAERKSTFLVSRCSLERLCTMGTVQGRIQRCISLYKKYPDNDSLLILCRELYKNNEYGKILQYTKDLDLKTVDGELAYLRLSSEIKKNKSVFEKEFYDWCLETDYSKWHHKIYSEYSAEKKSELWKIIDFREAVYTKKYRFEENFEESFIEDTTFFHDQIIRDFGRYLLFGKKKNKKNSELLDALEEKIDGHGKYYTSFYSARLNDRNRFEQAMAYAETDREYDNALWYYLDSVLKESAQKAAEETIRRRKSWKNPLYFDDYFDSLSVKLLSLQRYDDYYNVSCAIAGWASSEISARFSYISARLIQDDFIKIDAEKKGTEIIRLLNIALNSGTDLHYRFLAAEKLGLNQKAVKENLKNIGNRTEYKVDADAEKILYGLIDFGLEEFVQEYYSKFEGSLSDECVFKIAKYLSESFDRNNTCHLQSIRMASRRVMNPSVPVNETSLKLAYPRYFSESVHSVCEKYNLEEYLLYGLIRSESFFNASAKSGAGAVGLTQLMELTAADIGKKLKTESFDLLNPETNILFGGFYFNELEFRLDGDKLLAAFSYNSGISRVRSWKKSFEKDFGSSVKNDIFLEIIPYEETREYGRKINGSAAMYAMLYYGKNPAEVVDEIVK